MAWQRTVLTIAKTNATYTFPNSVNPDLSAMANGLIHQVVIAAGDTTAGTLTFDGIPYGGDANEDILESDGSTQVVITLTAGTSRSFMITNWSLETFSAVLAGVNGTGTITITISSWCD